MLDEFVANKLALPVNQLVVFLEILVEVLHKLFMGPPLKGQALSLEWFQLTV